VIEALLSYNSSDWDINEKDLQCNQFDSLNMTANLTIATDSNTTSKKIICQLRTHYSVNNVLLGKTDRPWISNISACYSNMDEIINGTNQYEQPRFLQDVKFITRHWKRYTQPIGLDALAIINQDHYTAVQLCTVAPLLFLTLDGHRPVNMEEWVNFAPPLTSDESLQCAAIGTPPTSSTGAIPSPTPVNPTIVAQPGDSNPTIVSKPTSNNISPGDPNPTIVSKPSVGSPTSNEIVIGDTPISKENDASTDDEGKQNTKTSGVSPLPKSALILQTTFLYSIVVGMIVHRML
jgi:hypothetical protein